MFQIGEEKPYARVREDVLDEIKKKVKEIRAERKQSKCYKSSDGKIFAYELDKYTVMVETEAKSAQGQEGRDFRPYEFDGALAVSNILKGACPFLQSYRFLEIGGKASAKGCESLTDYYSRMEREKKQFTVEQVNSLLLQLLLGLKALKDKGLVHYDLKAPNILVMNEDPLIIMVIDIAYNPIITQGKRIWKGVTYQPAISSLYIPKEVGNDYSAVYDHPQPYDIHCVGGLLSALLTFTEKPDEKDKEASTKYDYLFKLSKRMQYDAGRSWWPGKRWSQLTLEDILEETHWGQDKEARGDRIRDITRVAEEVLKEKTQGFYRTLQDADEKKAVQGKSDPANQDHPLQDYSQLAPPEIRDILLFFDTVVNNEEGFIKLVDGLCLQKPLENQGARTEFVAVFDAEDIYYTLEAIQKRSKQLLEAISHVETPPVKELEQKLNPVSLQAQASVSTSLPPSSPLLSEDISPPKQALENIPPSYTNALRIIKNNLSCTDEMSAFITRVKEFTRRLGAFYQGTYKNGWDPDLSGEKDKLVVELEAFLQETGEAMEESKEIKTVASGARKILKEKCIALVENMKLRAELELPTIKKDAPKDTQAESKDKICVPGELPKISFFAGIKRAITKDPPKPKFESDEKIFKKIRNSEIIMCSAFAFLPCVNALGATTYGVGIGVAVAINYFGNSDSAMQFMLDVQEGITSNAQLIKEINVMAAGFLLIIFLAAFLKLAHEHRQAEQEHRRQALHRLSTERSPEEAKKRLPNQKK